MSSPSRRKFLEKSLASTVLALSGTPSFAGISEINNQDGLYIHGLTTFDPSKSQQTTTSVILSLNLTSGAVKYKPLSGYQFGHSLITLPKNGYFSVPYGDDASPCLFLDRKFNIAGEIYAPAGYGFGGHGLLMPDNKTLFIHFNKQGGEITDTGQFAVIDCDSKKIVRSGPTKILHAHDIILSADQKHIVVADDGNIGESKTGPYVINSHQPALHLFDSTTADWVRSIPLDINGSLVHIEANADGAIFGATEQYVLRGEAGLDALHKQLGNQMQNYLDSFDPEIFSDEIPLPGPLVSVNTQSGVIEKYTDIRNQDPFDIKRNSFSGDMINVFTSHNHIARFDQEENQWQYKNTSEFKIEEPFGLVDISGTPHMAINGFNRGIAIFNTQNFELHHYYDVPTHGLKHMILG